jgi:hypothetical protein
MFIAVALAWIILFSRKPPRYARIAALASFIGSLCAMGFALSVATSHF